MPRSNTARQTVSSTPKIVLKRQMFQRLPLLHATTTCLCLLGMLPAAAYSLTMGDQFALMITSALLMVCVTALFISHFCSVAAAGSASARPPLLPRRCLRCCCCCCCCPIPTQPTPRARCRRRRFLSFAPPAPVSPNKNQFYYTPLTHPKPSKPKPFPNRNSEPDPVENAQTHPKPP